MHGYPSRSTEVIHLMTNPSARRHWNTSEKTLTSQSARSFFQSLINISTSLTESFSMTSLLPVLVMLEYCEWKSTNNYGTRREQIRHYYVTVMWLHETLLLAATILLHEYFPTCLKACNYCSVLHAKIACNYCTWNHCLTKTDRDEWMCGVCKYFSSSFSFAFNAYNSFWSIIDCQTDG